MPSPLAASTAPNVAETTVSPTRMSAPLRHTTKPRSLTTRSGWFFVIVTPRPDARRTSSTGLRLLWVRAATCSSSPRSLTARSPSSRTSVTRDVQLAVEPARANSSATVSSPCSVQTCVSAVRHFPELSGP